MVNSVLPYQRMVGAGVILGLLAKKRFHNSLASCFFFSLFLFLFFFILTCFCLLTNPNTYVLKMIREMTKSNKLPTKDG